MWTKVLADIAKLAPLSVIIAALAFLHNFWQSWAKRQHDEASALREIFNKLGVKAYLLNWSLLGDSTTLAGVLQIREAIESRIGKNPSAQELAAFVGDHRLFESVVEKAWRDAGIVEKFQAEALEFGKLRADLGNKVPLIDAALREIDTRLRLLFMIHSNLLVFIRQNVVAQQLQASTGKTDMMAQLHRVLLQACRIPDEKTFSAACSFLERFSEASAGADDTTILAVTSPRYPLVERYHGWEERKRTERQASLRKDQLVKELKLTSGANFDLLRQAAERLALLTRDAVIEGITLEHNYKFIGRTLKSKPGDRLQHAAFHFLFTRSKYVARKLDLISDLLEIRSRGVDDPDLDALVAIETEVEPLLKSAQKRGLSASATREAVLAKYKHLLSDAPTQRSATAQA